jgi:polysaccharide export outer membrane protein
MVSAGRYRVKSPHRVPRVVLSLLPLVMIMQASFAQAPADTAPPTAEYVIGVEDRLSIKVWKEPDLSGSFNVRPDGKISCLLIGDLQAAGRTPRELSDEITKALSKYVREPVVTVTVDEINSFKVYVLGEVKTQGVLNLKRRTRLLEAIALSGGLTQFANKSDILLVRYDGDKESRTRIDYRKVVSGEKPELNVFLKPGDTIIVN